MDFTISPRIEDFRARIARFVEDEIIPLEADRSSYDPHENIRTDVLNDLRARARAQGLWCLQLKEKSGGQGLGIQGMAVCYEEMNRSIFGPVVFNAAAPDDGNMQVLEKVGTEDQKAEWLAPIVRGDVRSAFVMTEPAPGSGSDPGGMMLTTARKTNDSYVIRGRKWFITGAEDSDHFILIARTSDDPRKGLSAFLHRKDTPGFRIERRIPIMGPEEHGGHCEVVYEDMEIPAENLLMEEGDGLKLTQIRLGPARLTHCMRWLGACIRAHEIASDYANRRMAFGKPLVDHEGVGFMLADNLIDLKQAELMVYWCADVLDTGVLGTVESSMAKVAVSEALMRVADRCVQVMGGQGVTADTIVEQVFREIRAFRIYDGPTEVHKWSLAKKIKRDWKKANEA